MKALATSKLSELFEVSYSTKFDLKQMTVASVDDGEGIAFVSRSAKNLGIVAHVRPYRGIDPLRAGLITVALEVWPESHWPGFALREADVFKTYMAWWCM